MRIYLVEPPDGPALRTPHRLSGMTHALVSSHPLRDGWAVTSLHTSYRTAVAARNRAIGTRITSATYRVVTATAQATT